MVDRFTIRCCIVSFLVPVIVLPIIFFVWAGSIGKGYDGRVQQITKQYNDALEAEQRAINESNELRQLNSELRSRIETVTGIAEKLRIENRELSARIDSLYRIAKAIRGALSEITEGLGGSEGVIQENLRILLEIAERNGVEVNE